MPLRLIRQPDHLCRRSTPRRTQGTTRWRPSKNVRRLILIVHRAAQTLHRTLFILSRTRYSMRRRCQHIWPGIMLWQGLPLREARLMLLTLCCLGKLHLILRRTQPFLLLIHRSRKTKISSSCKRRFRKHITQVSYRARHDLQARTFHLWNKKRWFPLVLPVTKDQDPGLTKSSTTVATESPVERILCPRTLQVSKINPQTKRTSLYPQFSSWLTQVVKAAT